MKTTVRQLRNKNGSDIPNQFIITEYNNGNKWTRKYFQSYKSIIAFKNNDGFTVLDKTYWDYSKTTGKYRNQFLNENIKETRKKIQTGEYKLWDLNNEYN
tara:strand:- start:240 stop:539 length:300 start_codon:yes stop_codon:yes gene_type:complete